LWVYLALIAIAILLYLSARFSGAETAITAIDNIEVMEQVSKGSKNADYLAKLREDLDRTIVAILIGNNTVNVAISALATLVAAEFLENLWMGLALGMLTMLILIFGEITPKAHAIDNRIKRSLKNAKWLYFMVRALGPLITALVAISKAIIHLIGGETRAKGFMVSDAQIRHLTNLGVEQGTVEDLEQDIIERALDFGDVPVTSVMKDVKDVFIIPSGTPLEEAVQILAERAFTRVPVVKLLKGEEDPEMSHAKEIVGVVYVKDLLGKSGGMIDDYVKPAFYVFPDRDAADLFEEMRRNRIHMGLVSDDGRLLGIVTLEDLIEEIMGEIHDEVHDKQFPDGEPD
jgi:putative hemolysin